MDKSCNTSKLVSFTKAYELVTENFDPKPHRRTVCEWLRRWRVRSTKANPKAVHGGGQRWFVLADIEKAMSKLVK